VAGAGELGTDELMDEGFHIAENQAGLIDAVGEDKDHAALARCKRGVRRGNPKSDGELGAGLGEREEGVAAIATASHGRLVRVRAYRRNGPRSLAAAASSPSMEAAKRLLAYKPRSRNTTSETAVVSAHNIPSIQHE
jgi:hypothetical protein